MSEWCDLPGPMAPVSEAERACEVLAAQQFGIISLEQALALKVSRRRVKTRVDTRRWLPVLPRVYRLNGAPDVWRAQAMAALLWAGAQSVLSHFSAAALWRIDGFRETGPIHVSVPGWLRAPLGIKVVPHTRQPMERRPSRVGVFRLTTMERTLIDLAHLSPNRVERALDDACVQQRTSAQRILAQLDDMKTSGRVGAGMLRLFAEARTGHSAAESHLEERLIQVLVRFKLPVGERQFVITDQKARLIGQVDFAYPERALVIECESFRWHAGRRQFYLDLSRRARLEDAGWRVLHVTHQDLTNGVEDLANRLRRLLT